LRTSRPVVRPALSDGSMPPLAYSLFTAGAPGRIRTCGTRFRKPLLYPLSYGGVWVPESTDQPGPRTARLAPPTSLRLVRCLQPVAVDDAVLGPVRVVEHP